MGKLRRAVCNKRSVAVIFILAGILSGLEAVLPYLDDVLPRGVLAILSFLTIGGGFIARGLRGRRPPHPFCRQSRRVRPAPNEDSRMLAQKEALSKGDDDDQPL